MNSKIRRIHMVGIGGAGMSGIAEVLLNQGYEVSGSDMSDSAVVRHLRELGAHVAVGHAAENVGDVQVLVKSTAINDENPELVEARRRNIAIIPRAEMLAELMRLRQGIAIAGTHGKTTTTSLTASIFDTAGFDPTVIIGGRLNAYGTNAHLGHGEYLIAEADESDGSFLCLLPIINVVTNVDEDHLDHYKTRAAIDEAFVKFMNNVPFYGLNIVCGDDPGVRALLSRVKRPVLTYGFAEDNVLRAVPLECGVRNNFEVWRSGVKLGQVSLPQPGRHNMLNALAAIGAAMEVDISLEKCAEGLNGFGGVGRSFEFKGEKGGVDAIAGLVVVEMILVHVCDDVDDRQEAQKRAVRFVSFGYQIFAMAEMRVGSVGIEPPADDHGRIKPGGIKNGSGQRRGGGFAVRARNGDALTQTHELGQHFRARNNGDIAAAGFGQFRVFIADGRRLDEHLHVAHVFSRVAHGHLCAKLPQVPHNS